MKENFCSTCGQYFKPNDLSIRCRLCMHNYHSHCWKKVGGCTTWGCAGKPAAGSENDEPAYKRCPFCGENVVDFAVMCRYCRSELITLESPSVEKMSENIRDKGDSFRKDPILTSLLNLIFPGAGYMYLGQFNKGIFWFLIAVAAWFFTRGLGLIAVYLWVMYDSSREAIKINRGVQPGKKTMHRH